jgi:hypothetical protein
VEKRAYVHILAARSFHRGSAVVEWRQTLIAVLRLEKLTWRPLVTRLHACGNFHVTRCEFTNIVVNCLNGVHHPNSACPCRPVKAFLGGLRDFGPNLSATGFMLMQEVHSCYGCTYCVNTEFFAFYRVIIVVTSSYPVASLLIWHLRPASPSLQVLRAG